MAVPGALPGRVARRRCGRDFARSSIERADGLRQFGGRLSQPGPLRHCQQFQLRTCFHDVTTGNNIGTNAPGQFYAAPGYDLCTGLGTPNGTNLINALVPSLSILAQPASLSVINGGTARFSVTADGSPPLGYRWRFNGTNLPAAGTVSGVTSKLS